MKNQKRFVQVALSGPGKRTFTYHLNPENPQLQAGQRIVVPFGRQNKVAFFIEDCSNPERISTRPITRILDEESLISSDLFSLCQWVSEYYFANLADCLTVTLPTALRSQKSPPLIWCKKANLELGIAGIPQAKTGALLTKKEIQSLRHQSGASIADLIQSGIVKEKFYDKLPDKKTVITGYRFVDSEDSEEFLSSRRTPPEKFSDTKSAEQLKSLGWSDYLLKLAAKAGVLEVVREIAEDDIFSFVKTRDDVAALKLSNEQNLVLNEMKSTLDNGFGVHLLHGVTGSGKTLVYCHLTKEVINKGKSALILTPEIHLSGTILGYFRGMFGGKVTIMHSAMTDRERLESWQGIKAGKYSIVIGPRSAVFAPLQNIGLIIVDEEHDGSYKQDDPAPRFHGRDVAIVRARNNSIPILLGSASPSIESYHKAVKGQYKLFELKERPAGMSLPDVEVIDMKSDRLHGDLPFMSFPLKKQIEETLDADDQVILFLNRRGYSPMVKCVACGRVPTCPQCDVTLTFHKTIGKLICHYCEFELSRYDSCANCKGRELIYPGAGTQKVEEALPRLFKMANAVRFDSDTASGRTRSHKILEAFANKTHNLLLGTQMVTKGLDLSGVTLVGVISADLGLDMPDFRASERTFARLLQVAGRSGRSTKKGKVLIQTYYPDSTVIINAANQDYISFFEGEIESRRLQSFPPFVRLVNVIFSSGNQDILPSAAKQFRSALEQQSKINHVKIDVLGPAPCAMSFLRKRYRRHLLIKTNQVLKLISLLSKWQLRQDNFGLPSVVRTVVDVDPDNMM